MLTEHCCVREIATSFKHRFLLESVTGRRIEDNNSEIGETDVLTRDIPSWLESVDDFAHTEVGSFDTSFVFDEPQSDETDEIPQDLKNYRTLIYDSTAFTSLTEHLRRELYLCSAEPDTMRGIRHDVVDSLLPPRTFSATLAAKIVRVQFQVDWDPAYFLRLQEYGNEDDVALENAITLTESAIGPQATLCKEYLNKIWPSTGVLTLATVRRLLHVKHDTSAKRRKPCLFSRR